MLFLCQKTCNRRHHSAEGSSLAEVTEQKTVRHVVKVCIFYFVCLIVPPGSAFTETLMENKTKAKKIGLIAAVTSMQAVYDKCRDCWTVLLFSNKVRLESPKVMGSES